MRIIAAVWLVIQTASLAHAQDFQNELEDQLKGSGAWSELCALTDCDQFPVGYNTRAFGPEVYYFPQFSKITERTEPERGMVAREYVGVGRFVDLTDDGIPLRSFSFSDSNSEALCCLRLMLFYDILKNYPSLVRVPQKVHPTTAGVMVRRYDRPGVYNMASRVLTTRSGEEPGKFPDLEEFIDDQTLSYNDDFWVLKVWEPDPARDSARRPFKLLSKRPLLNGRRVLFVCGRLCRLSTISFAGDEPETRPHVTLRGMVFAALENKFLCSLEEVKKGCDPSHPALDIVPDISSAWNAMLEAAQVFPQPQQ